VVVEKSAHSHEAKEQRQRSHYAGEQRRGNGNGEGNGRGEAREAMARAMERAAEASQQEIERFERAFGAFWREAGDDLYGPILRDVVRSNLELIGWMGRVAKAYAEIPSYVVRCQTPQDLFTSHERLFRQLMRDSYGTAARMLDTWHEEMPLQQPKSSRR
jgi:hypothetical protein